MFPLRAALLSLFVAAGQPALAADLAKPVTMEGFFAGHSRGKGVFTAINGVKRSFDVSLTGRWNGRTLTLREDFVFSDGERDRKTWRFVKTGPGRYTGTREDVVGETTVRFEGNVARFAYNVALDPKKPRNTVRFFDKIVFSSDGRSAKNTATVFKWLLPVARVRVDFTR
ncbi:MAG TPA: DUF3833 family protein [Rhizobiaceae bacterium]|nr:DUF3833 family protein [Rhizobiaceae bacterium]